MNHFSYDIPTILRDVLFLIKKDIASIPLTDTDGHNGNWYREPQSIINDVNNIIDSYMEKYK